MRRFFEFALLLCLLVLSILSAQGSGVSSSSVLQGYKGGPGEQTFGQAYGMKLPVSSTRLETFLKEHGLRYRVSADVASRAAVIPVPVWTSGADLSHIGKVYDIFDPSKARGHKAIHFFAYVDETGSVVYIENRYQYSGP